MAFKYKHQRPALTVDCVVFGLDLAESALKVLLIERNLAPFKGRSALPGGFVQKNETIEQAALRELSEETGLTNIFLEQLYTFGDPGRDPRGWVVSVAYYALVSPDLHTLRAASDAGNALWISVDETPELAFDHRKILETALERLRGKVTYAPVGFELLPKKFTLSQLQKLYEIILEREIDNRNFRKKILSMNLLHELNERQAGVPHRAARLYRFDARRYKQLTRAGFSFEL
ncbi:MAG: NUDIX domain-containing protein [Pyrinomonadaceae bacterium]